MAVNGSRDELSDDYAAKVWPSILFLSLVMVTGSCGNLLVCVVYRFDLSKVNNRFILALSGVDLINCLTSIPGELADLRFKYSFGESSFCPTGSVLRQNDPCRHACKLVNGYKMTDWAVVADPESLCPRDRITGLSFATKFFVHQIDYGGVFSGLKT